MTIKDIINLLPAKKEYMHAKTMMDNFDIRHKVFNENAEGYNQAIDDVISALSKITCSKCKELETIIEAWHTAFGTTQLTHALDRLETAERKIPEMATEEEILKILMDSLVGKKKGLEKNLVIYLGKRYEFRGKLGYLIG